MIFCYSQETNLLCIPIFSLSIKIFVACNNKNSYPYYNAIKFGFVWAAEPDFIARSLQPNANDPMRSYILDKGA